MEPLSKPISKPLSSHYLIYLVCEVLQAVDAPRVVVLGEDLARGGRGQGERSEGEARGSAVRERPGGLAGEGRAGAVRGRPGGAAGQGRAGQGRSTCGPEDMGLWGQRGRTEGGSRVRVGLRGRTEGSDRGWERLSPPIYSCISTFCVLAESPVCPVRGEILW